MSILEIMIAAVVLFIILTGVLGLVGTTTLMGVDAKQRNVMVNALNAYVEKVQSLPFASVALTSGGGALASVETTTVGEFTVTIRPTVVAGANDALKSLTVVIEVTAPNSRSSSFTTTVPIRDRAQFLTQANRTPETDPTIAFNDAFTPAQGAVVWGTSCTGATGVLKIAVDATASDGRLINAVSFWIDDSYYAKDSAGAIASWNPATQTYSASSFVWNTLQTEQVIQGDGSYLDVPIIADGMRTVVARVEDDEQIAVFTVRQMLVDNYAPGIPTIDGTTTVITASSITNTLATLTWPVANDGTTPADRYEVRLFRQPSTDTLTTSPFGRWPEVTGIGTPTENSLGLTSLTAFSRYYPAVRALSPRGLASEYTAGSPIFVTRPLITGTYAITSPKVPGVDPYNYTSTLTCAAPTFPTSSITYSWYRVDPTNPSGILAGSGQTLTANSYSFLPAKNTDPAPPVSYYCRVTFTPQGVTGGPSVVLSNTVKTTATDEIATTAYGAGTW